MKITDIKKQRNNLKRYSIFIDGEFAFGLDEIDVLYYKLFDREEISEELFKHIKENVVFTKARDTAVKYLSFKARTEKEVRLRLLKEDYNGDVVEKVISLLKKYSYIDDYAYAGSFLRDKFNLNGFGMERIIKELKQRGIDDEIIDEAVMENEVDEVSRAVSLIEKKYGFYNYDIKEKRRIAGFLARRGYSFQTIETAFNTVKEYL